MRHLLVLEVLLCFSFAYSEALAQQQRPNIRYILPDICAPNMSAYIEFYASPWDTLSFGKDGLYANNPDDQVRVELVRPADSTKVVVGPVVVSWSGRLISTQVFVLKNVSPDKFYWNDLSAEFRIPLRVVVSGRADSVSNADTLFIVKPYTDVSQITRVTDKSDSVMLGEIRGPNGNPQSVRSRRGALIVGNINFEGGGSGSTPRRYNVSTVDCDTTTPGNQGFLPFVMLGTGTIDGGGAIIAANAIGKNGGAGGGGGGGQVCDAGNSLTGPEGGNGFTGGASGGQNLGSRTAPSILDQQWSASGGIGSGNKTLTPLLPNAGFYVSNVFNTVGGNSLNGALGGISRSSGALGEDPQASGGGTGHPFGISGKSWDYGSPGNQKPAETAGGGIGRGERVKGDGGGYGTNGFSAALGGFQGGQRHGNEAVVPIAGGSGGASGNPQSACGGQGGGGGGAVRIAANLIKDLTIEALGAAGAAGSGGFLGFGQAVGGAGSGGHVSIHYREDALSADDALKIRANVLGGETGQSTPYFGAGRIRYDTPYRIGLTPTDNNNADAPDATFRSYTGITLSKQMQGVTSPYTRKVTVNGFGGAQGDIYFFRRSLRGRWEITDSTKLGPSKKDRQNASITFETQFTPRFPQPSVPQDSTAQDSTLFIVSVQKSFFPAPLGKEVIPDWVMSQSGTTIFTIDPLPLIATNVPSGTDLVFPQVERCGLETRSSDTALIITNKRGGVLRIDSIRALSPYFRITPGSSLMLPEYKFGGGSLVVPLRFTATSAIPADSLFLRTTLEIYHNDTISDIGGVSRLNPIIINLRVPIKTVLFGIQSIIPAVNGNGTIDFGNIAVGSSRDTTITIGNTSRDSVNYVVRAGTTPSITPFRFAERSLSSDSVQIRVRFQPNVAGSATTQTVIVRVAARGRCTDTTSFRFTLRGTGTLPQLNIALTDSVVKFGTIAPLCFPDSARLSPALVKVASAGNDILTVQARMASAPSFFTPTPAAFSLSPNNERQIQVQFNAPPTTATTTYRDTLIITTNDPRPEARVRRLPIEVTVQSSLAHVRVVPQDILRFGTARFFTATTQSVIVRNEGNTSVTVNIAGLRAPYQLVRPVPSASLPSTITLAPGAVDSVVVEFLATEVQKADVPVGDVLQLTFSNLTVPCALPPLSIALTATPTGPLGMQAHVWIDTLREVNMLRDTSIRIVGQVIGTVFDRRDNFRAAFRIRWGMFYPRWQAISSTFGTVTLDTNRADSLDRFVVISVPNVRLYSTPTTIATIGGTPIVTDTMRSVVEWVPAQTRWGQGDNVYVVERANYGNGLLVMNVLLQGASQTPRLPNNAVRRSPPTLVAIYPTPAREELSIKAVLGQEGVYTVRVVNMFGNCLFTQQWKQGALSQDASPSTLTIPLTSIPSGVYGVVIITPSGERESAMITIEK